jgi:hypothetical protein
VTAAGARVAAVVLVAAALAVAGALVALWAFAATHRVTPALAPAAFVPLSGPPPAPAQETWLVAVNLGCGHCAMRCAALAGAPAVRAGRARVLALIVDARVRPSSARVPGAVQVLWDSAGVWRGAWGRRAYGEALCFDPRGRCLRVIPPGAEMARAP